MTKMLKTFGEKSFQCSECNYCFYNFFLFAGCEFLTGDPQGYLDLESERFNIIFVLLQFIAYRSGVG